MGAHTRGAAVRRAWGSGAPRRTQFEPPAPVRLQRAGRGAAGRARGRDTKAEKRLGAGSRRCVPSLAASHYRSRGAGSGPSARVPRRHGSMSRSAEKREVFRGAREPPQFSRLLACGAGRRGRSQARAPDARGPLCAWRAPGPALRAAPRSRRRRCPCRGESALSVCCQNTINAGPRPTRLSPLARCATAACWLGNWPIRHPPPSDIGRREAVRRLTGEPRPRPWAAARAEHRRAAKERGLRVLGVVPERRGRDAGRRAERGSRTARCQLSLRPAHDFTAWQES